MTIRMQLGASVGNAFRRRRQSDAFDAWAARDINASIRMASGLIVQKSHAETLAAKRDAWLAVRPIVRTCVSTGSGDQQLPVLVRFLEGGHVVTENKGRTETDALANALWCLEQGGEDESL